LASPQCDSCVAKVTVARLTPLGFQRGIKRPGAVRPRRRSRAGPTTF